MHLPQGFVVAAPLPGLFFLYTTVWFMLSHPSGLCSKDTLEVDHSLTSLIARPTPCHSPPFLLLGLFFSIVGIKWLNKYVCFLLIYKLMVFNTNIQRTVFFLFVFCPFCSLLYPQNPRNQCGTPNTNLLGTNIIITGSLCSVRKIVKVHVHSLHLFIHNITKSGLIKTPGGHSNFSSPALGIFLEIWKPSILFSLSLHRVKQDRNRNCTQL